MQRSLIGLSIGLLVLLVVILQWQGILHLPFTADQLATPPAADNQAAQQILARVRRHIDVPSVPPPTVAEILDVSVLRKKSTFYDTAQNGDYVIVTERSAILYSPSRDVILGVMPVELQRKTGPDGQ